MVSTYAELSSDEDTLIANLAIPSSYILLVNIYDYTQGPLMVAGIHNFEKPISMAALFTVER